MARLIRPRVLVPLAVVVAIAVAITFVAAREGGSAASRQLRAVSFPGYRLLSTTGNSYAGTTGVYGICDRRIDRVDAPARPGDRDR